MIRTSLSALAVTAFLIVPAIGETKRQHDAHQHGHGTLKMAVEGKKLHIELEVPGADIVGFEHEAKSKADKKKVADARKLLKNPLSLIGLPTDAGCKLASADVEIGAQGHDSHEKKEHGHDHKHDKHEEKHEEAGHSEVHAVYALSCEKINSITTIAFPYFDNFPNSEELDVTFLGPKGQRSFEASRKKTRIDLSGMM